MKIERILYTIEKRKDIERILEVARRRYTLASIKGLEFECALYDTFDWRLYNSGYRLTLNKEKLELSSTGNETLIFSLETEDCPVYIYNFKESSLKDKLGPIIKMRALFKLVNIKTKRRKVSLLNKENKTVLRIFIDNISVKNHQDISFPCMFLTLQKIRGYQNSFSAISKIIESFGYRKKKKDLFYIILDQMNKRPGSYSSKIKVSLNPVMGCGNAYRIILSNLLCTMVKNEEGVKNKIDTEFLHDFRVALRRTRSLLSQVKYVFPDRKINKYKNYFKYLSKLTNEPRDTDVYILKMRELENKLFKNNRESFSYFLEYLKRKNKQSYKVFRVELDSVKYKTIISNWMKFLNNTINPESKLKNTNIPVIEIACKAIGKRYRKILDLGKKVTQKTPPELLHVLRIECKKLRYLLEFFVSLFPRKILKKLVLQMKNMQDSLGNFHDLQIQQIELKKYISDMDSSYSINQEMQESLLNLNNYFIAQQRSIQLKYADVYKEFNSQKTHKSFKEIIAHRKRSIRKCR